MVVDRLSFYDIIKPKGISMDKILCGRRKRLADKHWEDVDCKDVKITKPTILIFGGNLTTHPEQANSYAKTIYKFLNKGELEAKNFHIFEDFDCFSFYYKLNLVVCTYNRRSSGQILNDELVGDIEEFYNNTISELVEEEIRLAKTEQGDYFHPLSNLILFAHSAGSYIASQLEEMICSRLLEELDEETVYSILKGVKYYGFASYVKVENFDQTYIEGTKDITTMEYYPAVSFDVQENDDSSVFNYYSCQAPFYESEKHSAVVGKTDVTDVDALATMADQNESFEKLKNKLKGKIIIDPSQTWKETLICDETFEINSVNFANLNNGEEKVLLLKTGHELQNIVDGCTLRVDENNPNDKVEDMFVHPSQKHAFDRKMLDLSNIKSLAYITLSDDMTTELINKCELNATKDKKLDLNKTNNQDT